MVPRKLAQISRYVVLQRVIVLAEGQPVPPSGGAPRRDVFALEDGTGDSGWEPERVPARTSCTRGQHSRPPSWPSPSTVPVTTAGAGGASIRMRTVLSTVTWVCRGEGWRLVHVTGRIAGDVPGGYDQGRTAGRGARFSFRHVWKAWTR
ncbi:hypothetical protein GCM10017687_81030 [Streptomyces echinatus]